MVTTFPFDFVPTSPTSELNFSHIFDSLPEPVLITHVNGAIYYANHAWEHLTGYTMSEVQYKKPHFLHSSKTSPSIYKKIWISLLDHKSYKAVGMVNRKKDGSEYVQTSIFFPVLKFGEPLFFIQIQHDCTKEQMEEAQKTAFVSIASHELKTPVTTLLLLTQTLLRHKQINERDLSLVTLMHTEVSKLINLLDELLDISRIDLGKLHISLTNNDIDTVVEHVAENMRLLYPDHVFRGGESEQVVSYIDMRKIEQVLVNLFTNAAKYSPPQSEIVYSIRKIKNSVVFSIQDRGTGIAKRNIPHIFDKFYQVDQQTPKGFGLGLYISKEIVKLHKGKIWVESTKGKGSTFFFSLPIISIYEIEQASKAIH